MIPVFAESFGGTVSAVRSISKELAKTHDVVVYTTTAVDSKHDFEPKEEIVDGYRVIYFKRTFKSLCYSGFFGQLNLSYDMLNAVRKNLKDFDVVHVHSWQQFPDVLVGYYAKKYNVPFVLQVHGSLPNIISKQRLKKLFDILIGYKLLDNASKVIALHNAEAAQYRTLGVPKSKIAIVPNGMDISQFSNLPSKGSFKKKYSIDQDERIILFLGRLHVIKGLDILVKAFADVCKKVNTVRLAIVGPDDGYLAEIQALVKNLELNDKVLFTGPLYGTAKVEAYVDSDVCVLPSRYETFPISLLEAYACAKPVICSRLPGLRELVINETTGILFELGDSKQLSSSILSLLTEANAEKIGQNGRLFIESNFTIDIVCKKLEKLYSSLSFHIIMR